MKFEIRNIEYGSFEYKSEILLRDKVLRKPLGLHFTNEDLEKECGDIHMGAFAGSQLFGCVLLRPISKQTVKMRQVAVDGTVQRTGIGSELVAACERKALELGYSEIELSARDVAVPFYLKCGYEIFGEPFTEVTIPHRKMRKKLC